MLLCSSGSGTTSAERGSGVRGGDVGGCIVFGPDARKDERRKGAEAGRERRKEQAAAIRASLAAAAKIKADKDAAAEMWLLQARVAKARKRALMEARRFTRATLIEVRALVD